MKSSGGGRNEQKINSRRLEENLKRLRAAQVILKELKSRPFHLRTPDHSQQIQKQAGILKQAQAKLKVSETHSRKGKVGKR